MKKQKNKKVDNTVIDLRERQNIKIISPKKKKKSVVDAEMREFEKRLALKYDLFCDFTNLYIEINAEKEQNISEEYFNASMQNVIKQNTLLENMLKSYITDKKEQEN